jgi:hypothetical protein
MIAVGGCCNELVSGEHEATPAASPQSAGHELDGERWSLSSGQQEALKLLAIVTMVVDHVGVAFLAGGPYEIARAVGRLAFPLFGLLIAFNLTRHGVPPMKYYTPLALLLVVSQVPYALFSEFGAAGRLNIFAELLGGVMLIDGVLGERRAGTRLALSIAGLVLAALGAYGAIGGIMVLAWALALRTRTPAAAAFLVVALVLVNAGSRNLLVPLLLLPLLTLMTRVPLRLTRLPRWGWYAFYPAHMLVLVLLQQAFPAG